MATPVSWRFGPWATGGQSPYANVTQPNSTPTPSAYDTMVPTEPTDSGIGGKGISGTSEYGPMTASELAGMWGGTLGQKAVGMGVNSLVSGVAPNISLSSFYGMAPKAAVTVASLLSSLFGGIRGIDAEYGVPTEADIQSARDIQGAFAGDEAAAAREAGLANAQTAESSLGQQGFAPSRGNQPGGWMGQTTPPSGMPNPDIDTTQPGWGSNQRSMGEGDGQSPGNDGPSPGGSAEAGGGEAFGGVHTTKRGRSRTSLYGEAGPETAIFIPHTMKKPGIQGQEREVRAALKQYLKALKA